MMKTSRWLLFGLLIVLSSVVHAEGGCPPGMAPASGTDINSCTPLPPEYYGNQQQAPPERWVDKWTSIATDIGPLILGAAVNMSSSSEAEQVAMADCRSKGGTQCKVDLTIVNGCAAVVNGDTVYNMQFASSLSEATQLAINACNAATTNCHVYYSACSLPVRIQ